MLIAIFSILSISLVLPPISYYLWMKDKGRGAWGFEIRRDYRPSVTLIIATFNEASVVRRKLENVQNLDYPEDKLKVIVVDSNSSDGTLEVCREFLRETNFRFPTRLISEDERLGKSHALNTALQFADGEIIATSDADSYWDSEALVNSVSYFWDPSVGAIMGRESLTNVEKSVHTESEGLYLRFYRNLRLGESKLHSTFIFNGGLSVYRRSAFDKFEDRPGYSDDVGTVVRIISNGYRCVYAPDAVFNDTAAYSLAGRLMLKSRRAQHLIAGIIESIRFKINRRFNLPWVVVLFNFYLHILSPLIAITTLFVAIAVLVVYFQVIWFIPLLLIVSLAFKMPRLFAISYVTSNIALVMGLIEHWTRRRSRSWRKIEEMRHD